MHWQPVKPTDNIGWITFWMRVCIMNGPFQWSFSACMTPSTLNEPLKPKWESPVTSPAWITPSNDPFLGDQSSDVFVLCTVNLFISQKETKTKHSDFFQKVSAKLDSLPAPPLLLWSWNPKKVKINIVIDNLHFRFQLDVVDLLTVEEKLQRGVIPPERDLNSRKSLTKIRDTNINFVPCQFQRFELCLQKKYLEFYFLLVLELGSHSRCITPNNLHVHHLPPV